jgi:hypothetical protein
MATVLKTNGSKIEAVGFVPAVSAGYVSVVCKNHNFVVENNVNKCTKCDAVKAADGSVSVDTTEDLSGADLSTDGSVAINSGDTSSGGNNDSNPSLSVDNGGKKQKVKFVYFIPLIAAVLIIGSVVVWQLTKNKKEQK